MSPVFLELAEALAIHNDQIRRYGGREAVPVVTDAATPFEVTTDGRALVLTPVLDPRRQKRFASALDKVNRQYPKALKKLAE